MIREEYIRRISNGLAILASEAQLSNGLNMQNINIVSENFYRDFLNLLFHWNLENCNYLKKNFAGIDLYSDIEKIVIQISSVISRKKIQDSINRIDKERFRGYHFIFIAMVNSIDSKTLYKSYDNENSIHFVPAEDIWDHAKILSFVNNCKIEEIKDVSNFIKKIFSKIDDKIMPRLLASVPGNIEHFIGREDELLKIKKKIKNVNPLYLWGEPGVGKTELAISFANSCSSKVFFTTFDKNIKETIAKLRFIGEEQNADISIQYRINIELLRMFGSDTILIIDNFDLENNLDPDLLRNEKEFMEIINLDLKIIFTTRNNYGVGINITPIDDEKLLSLMLHFYNHKEKSAILKEIIKVVQHNTLVVELCARTLGTVGGISPEQLLMDLRNLNIDGNEYKGIYSVKDRARFGNHLRRKLIEHICHLYKLSCLTVEEKQILSCAALLPISGIDYNLFIKCFPLLSIHNGVKVLSYNGKDLLVSKGDYEEFFSAVKGDIKNTLWTLLTRHDDRKNSEEELNINSIEVIDRMIQKGWIQANENNEIIKLHPILLAVIMSEETIKPDIQRCFDFIKYVFEIVQPENCEFNTLIYAEYGTDIIRNAIERLYLDDNIKDDIKEILSNQVYNIAINYDNYGSKLKDEANKKAIDYHMMALKIFRQIQPNGEHMAICYDRIVDYYNEFGEYKLALNYALVANNIFNNMVSTNLEDVRTSNHKVGRTYAFLEDYEKQKEYYQKNIVLDLDFLPDGHPVLAHDYTILSFAYHNMKDMEGQLECLLKAYNILEKMYQKNFINNFSYPIDSCIYEWINLLQGLIYTYNELGDKEKVDFFVNKMDEQQLARILLEHNMNLVKTEDNGTKILACN